MYADLEESLGTFQVAIDTYTLLPYNPYEAEKEGIPWKLHAVFLN